MKIFGFTISTNKNKNEDFKNNFNSYLQNMENDKARQYIENRVIEQINWYNSKSIHNQSIYKRLSIISIIMSGSIPVFTLVSDFNWIIKLIIAIISSGVTIISTINSLFNYKEIWGEYRTNCEILKSNLYLYFARQGEFEGFEDEQAFNRLVGICEKQIMEEFIGWKNLINRNSSTESEQANA